ncbi:unnamed protein product [Ectocarpus fasciculatus]
MARPGEVTALMGPSGSGKTTLLNVLGGRALANMTGEMFMNGRPYSKSMRKTIAYVMQEDIFFMNLTVHEQLTFTCQLRLPESVSGEEKAAAVDHVIHTLGIQKCQHTQIMLVSGGEKKRCNIGTELLTNPSLILLDEPTSGLDSTAAASLMKTMRALAQDRMTVMMSIHQPSSQVFYSFDKLVLLADGHVVYFGPPRKCLPYLATLSFVPPADYNPADYVMDLLTDGQGGGYEEGGGRPRQLGEDGEFDLVSVYLAAAPLEEDLSPREVLRQRFDGAAHVAAVGAQLTLDCSRRAASGTAVDIESGEGAEGVVQRRAAPYPLSYGGQLHVLFDRDFKNRRSELFRFYNVVECVAVGLIAGSAWFWMPRSERSIDDRSALIFFGIIRWYFWSMFRGMFSFYPERSILSKERAAGSYYISAYFMAKSLSEVPLTTAFPAIYLCICYPMANSNPAVTSFLGTLLTQSLTNLCAESVGLLIGAATADTKLGVTCATLSALAFMVVGGFFVRNVPFFLQWLLLLSPLKYAYMASIQFEFTSNVPCDGSDILSVCEDGSDTASREDVWRYFDAEGSVWFNLGMLLVLTLVCRAGAYSCLRFLKFNQGRD